MQWLFMEENENGGNIGNSAVFFRYVGSMACPAVSKNNGSLLAAYISFLYFIGS